MDDARQRRVAENESKSREVNEALEAHSPGERRSPGVFLCECGREQCHHVIEISPRDYEQVRANSRRFMVYPGHEQPEVESIVEAQSGYLVVEKGAEAGRVAEAEDPRA